MMEALAVEAAAGLGAASAPRAVLDDFLRRSGAEATSVALRAEVERLQQQADEGDWIVGRTGGGRTAEAQRETTAGQYRDDEILWLREERVRRYGLRALPQLGAAVDRLVEALQPQLDPSLRWELGGRTTQMVACYHPGSAGYSYHVDNPDNDGRVVTAILYLNADWDETQGGAVRLHPSLLPAPTPAPTPAAEPVGLAEMSVAAVAASLSALEGRLEPAVLQRLRQRVTDEEIDGEVLSTLTEADMEEVLGLGKFGQRRKLSQHILRLQEEVAGGEGKVGVWEEGPVDVAPLDGRLLLFWSDRCADETPLALDLLLRL